MERAAAIGSAPVSRDGLICWSDHCQYQSSSLNCLMVQEPSQDSGFCCLKPSIMAAATIPLPVRGGAQRKVQRRLFRKCVATSMVLEEGMAIAWFSDSGLLLPIVELEKEGAIAGLTTSTGELVSASNASNS